jgi:hypothetical protein
MNVVEARFERLSDVPLADIFGAVGVYVLWTKDAVARPSYIGEGNLLRRLNEHVHDWLGRTGDGYVAILGYTSERPSKFDAEVVEGTLLEAADRLGRFPIRNEQGPRMRALWSRGQRGHNTIRVKIRGWHPLLRNARIQQDAVFNWRWDDYRGWALDDRLPWRSR